jgi:hypothetical protein
MTLFHRVRPQSSWPMAAHLPSPPDPLTRQPLSLLAGPTIGALSLTLTIAHRSVPLVPLLCPLPHALGSLERHVLSARTGAPFAPPFCPPDWTPPTSPSLSFSRLGFKARWSPPCAPLLPRPSDQPKASCCPLPLPHR